MAYVPSKPPPRRTDTAPGEGTWARRRTEPGWLLLPLRAFLGVTFAYAGLQKLANPDYLDPRSPTSIAHQMSLLRHSSPIGPLLTLSTHAPTLVGVTVALGELAVGIGTLLGLLTRLAALGGTLLAVTFFLTVSWSTTPYYYGADIVFVFAWLVMMGFGSGGVLSLDTWLRNRARRQVGLGPEPATVKIAAPRLRALCARGAKCGLGIDGSCSRLTGCPIFPVAEQLPASRNDTIVRRTLVMGGVAAGAVGMLSLLTAAVTAAIGRAVGWTPGRSPAPLALSSASPPPTRPASTSGSTATKSAPAAAGTAVAAVSSVPVGQAHAFTNPADGNPAWVVHPSGNTFVAFSAVCTHTGCPVQYEPSALEFICPCHGGTYDARTGKVKQGPPPAPLPPIPVHVANGQVYLG